MFANPQTHPLLAQVIDNKDPKNQGRVKVKFLGWKQADEQTTDWIRALTPGAGGGGDKVAQNRGLVTIPEIGDQVMVDFELNNPDRPFITGSVFHGQHGTGGGGGNNVKSLTSKSGHTVRLDDGGGMTVMDKTKLNHIVVDGEKAINVTAANTIFLTNGKSSIIMDGDTITINARTIKILSSSEVVMASQDKMEIVSKTNILMGSSAAGITIDAKQAVQILSELMVRLYAQNVDAIGSAGASINAPMVKINS